MLDKLTDKEIVKALEERLKENKRIYSMDIVFLRNLVDLINRLQAEKERLEKLSKHHQTLINMLNEGIATAKAEARKEFAERLKGQCNCVGASILANKIDNILKEMESNNE